MENDIIIRSSNCSKYLLKTVGHYVWYYGQTVAAGWRTVRKPSKVRMWEYFVVIQELEDTITLDNATIF